MMEHQWVSVDLGATDQKTEFLIETVRYEEGSSVRNLEDQQRPLDPHERARVMEQFTVYQL